MPIKEMYKTILEAGDFFVTERLIETYGKSFFERLNAPSLKSFKINDMKVIIPKIKCFIKVRSVRCL